MPIEQDITALVTASNSLTGVVENKIDDIDQKVNTTITGMEAWKTNAFTSAEATNLVAPGCYKTIDLQHLSTALYYPVVLGGSANYTNEYEICRWYSYSRTGAQPAESLAALFLTFSFVGHSWGGNPISLMIHRAEQVINMTCAALGFASYYKPVVFLRGGYLYDMRSNVRDCPYTIYETQTLYYHNATTNIYDRTIGPVDEATAMASDGGLTMDPIYNTLHSKYIEQLGG
ncbi:MAG: hypothetical protein ACI8WB_001721 [Phenylobacterium sp.]|jgi:hypothetical protein